MGIDGAAITSAETQATPTSSTFADVESLGIDGQPVNCTDVPILFRAFRQACPPWDSFPPACVAPVAATLQPALRFLAAQGAPGG